MALLYVATGDGIARLDEAGGGWTVELFLRGSGAQCLAIDPADADTLYAGLREGGVRRSLHTRERLPAAAPAGGRLAGVRAADTRRVQRLTRTRIRRRSLARPARARPAPGLHRRDRTASEGPVVLERRSIVQYARIDHAYTTRKSK